MPSLLFFLVVFAILPLLGVWAAVKATQASGQARQALYRRLAKLAPILGGVLEERTVLGAVQSRVTCLVEGRASEVRLGWYGDDFALVLEVINPELQPLGFQGRWGRALARFARRGAEDSVRVRWRGERELVVEGPGDALLEVFAEAPAGLAAALFQEPEGSARAWTLEVGAGRIRLECDPDLRSFPGLPKRLEALSQLSSCSAPQSGERVLGAPVRRMPSSATSGRVKAVGKATVSIQAGQRCAYCHEDIAGLAARELKTCGACSIPMHAECLSEHGGCCTLGCRNDPRTRGRA